jgi:hypothetical protein
MTWQIILTIALLCASALLFYVGNKLKNIQKGD